MVSRSCFIVDACALIGLAKADPPILPSVVRHLGEVHVATPVFEEVKGVDPAMAQALGVLMYEPSLDMAALAAVAKGRLSFHDRLCLALAKENGWVCVSNEEQLRAVGKSELVPVLGVEEVVARLGEARALKLRMASDWGTTAGTPTLRWKVKIKG